MLRKVFDSSLAFAVPALALALAAVFFLVDLRLAPRPGGGLAELRELRERDDVNLVFIVIDTLRADRLGCYGHDRPTSRVLDRLAAGGIRFALVEAPSSWTKCSMASLWTGLDPVRTGVTRFNHAIPEEAVLPAEILRDAGFATVGIYRNGWVAPNFGFGQGFDDYLKPGMNHDAANLEKRPGAKLVGTDEGVTRSALAFLDASGHERFFLYLHYMDVHQYAFDGVAADLGFGSTYRDSYDAALNWTDRNIGLLIDALERRDLSRRTVIAVTSDHGEAFGEHDSQGHARTLYTEVTHVPWILSLPFWLSSPAVVKPRVRSVDIWPTLLDLLGLEALPNADGRSLVGEIEAAIAGSSEAPGPGATPPPAFSYIDRRWGKPEEAPDPLVGVRYRDRSLIVQPGAEEDAVVGVFDLSSDPREETNLAVEGEPLPEWTRELEVWAQESFTRAPPWGVAPEVEIDELNRMQLRALGYVIE